MVVALSGRRIDAPNAAHPAFPLENIDAVRGRLLRALDDLAATILVCSAACGADLLALEAAETLGARRRIVLPFDPEVFRETSVVDRPGGWGSAFDRCVRAAGTSGDLVNLALPQVEESYAQANAFILEEAVRLAGATRDRVTAMLVWDGVAKGEADHTVWLGNAARAQRLNVIDVSTL
ncbi:MAG TPA: hypothetical protein VIY53_11965 [Acidobacteriaceae bacterium]